MQMTVSVCKHWTAVPVKMLQVILLVSVPWHAVDLCLHRVAQMESWGWLKRQEQIYALFLKREVLALGMNFQEGVRIHDFLSTSLNSTVRAFLSLLSFRGLSIEILVTIFVLF